MPQCLNEWKLNNYKSKEGEEKKVKTHLEEINWKVEKQQPLINVVTGEEVATEATPNTAILPINKFNTLKRFKENDCINNLKVFKNK